MKHYMNSEEWTPNYNLYSCDIIGRTCGGGGLSVKDFCVTRLIFFSSDVVEILDTKMGNFKLRIVLISKPLDTKPNKFIERLRNMESYLNVRSPVPVVIPRSSTVAQKGTR